MATDVASDAKATVTEFIDYTEHYPADLHRSFSLIANLDEAYQCAAARIIKLTREYANLSNVTAAERPDPVSLRRSIAETLNHISHLRQNSVAEIERLCQNTGRHCVRLSVIKQRLQALPFPPSHGDGSQSKPDSSLISLPRKCELDKSNILIIRVNPTFLKQLASQSNSSAKTCASTEEKELASTSNPNTTILPSRTLRSNASIANVNTRKELINSPRTRLNSPTSVNATDSTKFNASETTLATPESQKSRNRNVNPSCQSVLNSLEPPPADAKRGSKWKPWCKLSAYELAQLRKKVKKNANWIPTDGIIQKELLRKGRDRDSYEKAKKQAEERGEPFLDDDEVDGDPNKILESTATQLKGVSKHDTIETNLNEGEPVAQERIDSQVVQRVRDTFRTVSRRLEDNNKRSRTQENSSCDVESNDSVGSEQSQREHVRKKPRQLQRGSVKKVDTRVEKVMRRSRTSRPGCNLEMSNCNNTSEQVTSWMNTTQIEPPQISGTNAGKPGTALNGRVVPELPGSAGNGDSQVVDPAQLGTVCHAGKTTLLTIHAGDSTWSQMSLSPSPSFSRSRSRSQSRSVRPVVSTLTPHPVCGEKLASLTENISSVSAATHSPSGTPLALASPAESSQFNGAPVKAKERARSTDSVSSLTTLSESSVPCPVEESSRTFESLETIAATISSMRVTRSKRAGNGGEMSDMKIVEKGDRHADVETKKSKEAWKRMTAKPKAEKANVITRKQALNNVSTQAQTRNRMHKGDVTNREDETGKITIRRSSSRLLGQQILSNGHCKGEVNGSKMGQTMKDGESVGSGANESETRSKGSKGDVSTTTYRRKNLRKNNTNKGLENISMDEPRYCFCDGVSWGSMIACESESCAREWFHLPCVGLDRTPPRRSKWYCSECQLKLGVSEKGRTVCRAKK